MKKLLKNIFRYLWEAWRGETERDAKDAEERQFAKPKCTTTYPDTLLLFNDWAKDIHQQLRYK